MLLKLQRPFRLLLELRLDSQGICAPRPEVTPERVQHQHAFGFSALCAPCRSGQCSGQDHQADAETCGNGWPAWIDRSNPDAAAHHAPLAISDVRTAALYNRFDIVARGQSGSRPSATITGSPPSSTKAIRVTRLTKFRLTKDAVSFSLNWLLTARKRRWSESVPIRPTAANRSSRCSGRGARTSTRCPSRRASISE